ncbi:MAG TPA: STAS domain-containing protein [Candidatus Eisenbacteria bacterium]|jgi:anti-anti-sigma factor
MKAGTPARSGRAALAVNLQLSHGAHGASARLEWHERGGGRVALLQLSGWIDRPALTRLERTVEDLAARGAGQLVLDCSRLRHIDYRLVPALVDALSSYEARAGGIVVCGLSSYLRDLFRLGGCEPRLRCWPAAADLIGPAAEPGGESAS